MCVRAPAAKLHALQRLFPGQGPYDALPRFLFGRMRQNSAHRVGLEMLEGVILHAPRCRVYVRPPRRIELKEGTVNPLTCMLHVLTTFYG